MAKTLEKLIEEAKGFQSSDIKSSKMLFEKALKMAIKNNDDKNTVICNTQLANLASIGGRYSDALQLGLKALEDSKVLNDDYVHYMVDFTLGNTYAHLGNLEKAMSFYMSGLERCRASDGKYIQNFLNNISVIYSRSGNLEKSLSVLLEAFELAKSENSSFQGLLLTNIAEVHLKLGNLASAEQYNYEAKEFLNNIAFNGLYSIQCEKVFAYIDRVKGKFEEALKHASIAKQLCEQLDTPYRLCTVIREQGKIYEDKGEGTEALNYYSKAYEIAEQLSAQVELRDLSLDISKCYENMGDYREAYVYLKKFYTFESQIKTEALENQLIIQNSEFEIIRAKKDSEIERLIYEETKSFAEKEKLRAEILTESLKDIHLIGELGRIITTSLDMSTVFKHVYRQIKTMFNVDVIGICVYDKPSEMIQFKLMMKNGKKMPLKQTVISDEQSIAAKCIREKKTIIMNEVQDAPMKSVIYMPLVVTESVIGAMTLQSLKDNAFSERTIEMSQAMSLYIAIALNNSLQSEALALKTKELERISQKDSLTGLFNRRYVTEKLLGDCKEMAQKAKKYSVALMDLDHFKTINDTFGHQTGDEILIAVSRKIKRCLRNGDVLARWGGEEFLLLMPETDIEEAKVVCEKIRQEVSRIKKRTNNKRVNVTITIGISTRSGNCELTQTIQNADRALYDGKYKGRNCIVAR